MTPGPSPAALRADELNREEAALWLFQRCRPYRSPGRGWGASAPGDDPARRRTGLFTAPTPDELAQVSRAGAGAQAQMS